MRLVLNSKKLRSDGKGQESQIAEHDLIDVGLLDEAGNYLYLQRHRVEKDETELIITVDKLPVRAGIDPLNKLIDRSPDDNLIEVGGR